MKATHNVNEASLKIQYPCLMSKASKLNQLMVLMIGVSNNQYGRGTVLIENKFHPLGEYRDDWDIKDFIPLEDCETIDLSNE